ncbi:MAG TPA: DUF4382 domain-containing protein [Sulfuricaulis sp.]|nr:DUF4382 domain-containing protein [Sulfuricaulis sp.]
MNTSAFHARLAVLVSLGAILTLASCGGGGGSDGAGTGTLSLQITDGPVETAKHVYVQFSGLELHAADGQRTTLYYCQDPADATLTTISEGPCTTPAAPKRFDLLALNSGNADFLLEDFTLPAGRYNWIRLMVDTDGEDDSCIVLVVNGECEELTIPSGAQTGLKLNRGFDVPAGGNADFTIDFDLRKSVHVTGTGEYMLRPTLRLADNSMTGAIAGTVDPSLVPAGCTPAVYVYEGSGVTPDDIDADPNTPDPVTTATVKLDNGIYRYKAAYLEAGSYTIAFTCDAAADDLMLNDALTFSGATTLSVTAKTVTVHNF